MGVLYMKYKVVLESFEGPMDLLLHLIDEAKIDIYDIPINEITEQYIDYITRMEELDLEVTSEFLVMAATLLEIKSKMLLPQVKKDEAQQLEIEEVDPRLELVKKLVNTNSLNMLLRNCVNLKKYKKEYIINQKKIYLFCRCRRKLSRWIKELVEAFNYILAKNKDTQFSIDINEIQKRNIL